MPWFSDGAEPENTTNDLLVQKEALEKAEAECLKDEDKRHQRRLREAETREYIDQNYIIQFAERIRELYPKCPAGREKEIAEHVCRKYSGRVGRTAAAKRLDETMIKLAVIAYIRHTQTNYDELLSKNFERSEAREEVNNKVFNVLSSWQA